MTKHHAQCQCGHLTVSVESGPDVVIAAYGCFEMPVPEPTRAIWTREKHDWVNFPKVWPSFPAAAPA